MPYDPSNPQEFRGVLNQLSEVLHLSSEAAINLVRADREPRGKTGDPLPVFDLTRSSLDRFKKGDPIKNVSGLRELWRVLEGHPDYRPFFPTVPNWHGIVSPGEALGWGLKLFYGDCVAGPVFDMATLRTKLLGQYLMYRPNWRLGCSADNVMTALIEITEGEPTPRISKVQNFPPTEDMPAYPQSDHGVMFSFGTYMHFMMREDERGTCVRYGAIGGMGPLTGLEPVDYFQGMLYTTSHLKLYPAQRFFCRRLELKGEFFSESLPRGAVPDSQAREYLALP